MADETPESPLRILKVVRAPILGALVVYFAIIFVSGDRSAYVSQLLWTKFFPAFSAAALILAASCAAGGLVLKALQISLGRGITYLLSTLCIGSCCVSLLTLLLGVCGVMNRWIATAVLLALMLAWVRLLRLDQATARQQNPRTRGVSLVATVWGVVTALFVTLNVIGAFLPPWEYDVLEYHLGAPAEYHRAGRVVFLKDNVYSNFPSNGEMTYLLGMILSGDKVVGAHAGKLVNVGYGLAIAALIALAGKHAFGSRSVWEPFLAVYACPCILIAGMVAHVTMPLMLYLTFTLYALLRWLKGSEELTDNQWLILCGLGVGGAMGTKYTGFLLVLGPVVAVVIVRGAGSFGRRIGSIARVLIPAAILVSPWMLRNGMNTGNPTYPLLYRVFGGSNWDGVKDARFAKAHSPRDLSLPGFGTRALGFLTNKHRPYLSGSLVVLALLSLATWRAPRNWPLVIVLVAFWLVMVALWFYFTHQIDRFLAPSIAVLGCLCAAGACNLSQSRAGLTTLRVLVAVFSVFALLENLWLAHAQGVLDGAFALATDGEANREFMRDHTDFGEVWEAFEYLGQETPTTAKVLLVGEARPFYCPRPTWNGTVFDDVPLETVLASGTVSDAFACLSRERVTHVLFNWREIGRLSHTYAFEHNGRKRSGYLHLTPDQQQVLATLKQKHLNLVKAVGKQYESGERHIGLYEILYGRGERQNSSLAR